MLPTNGTIITLFLLLIPAIRFALWLLEQWSKTTHEPFIGGGNSGFSDPKDWGRK